MFSCAKNELLGLHEKCDHLRYMPFGRPDWQGHGNHDKPDDTEVGIASNAPLNLELKQRELWFEMVQAKVQEVGLCDLSLNVLPELNSKEALSQCFCLRALGL